MTSLFVALALKALFVGILQVPAAASGPAEEHTSASGRVRMLVQSTSQFGHDDIRYLITREGEPAREMAFPFLLEKVAVLETGEFAGFGYGFDDSTPRKRYRVLAIFGSQGEVLLDHRTEQSLPPDRGWGPKALGVDASDACRRIAFAVYDPEGPKRRRILVYSLPKAELLLDRPAAPPGMDLDHPRFSETRRGKLVDLRWIGKLPLLLVTWDQAVSFRRKGDLDGAGDAFMILDEQGRRIWELSLCPESDGESKGLPLTGIVLDDFDSRRAVVERDENRFALRLHAKIAGREPGNPGFEIQEGADGKFAVLRR